MALWKRLRDSAQDGRIYKLALRHPTDDTDGDATAAQLLDEGLAALSDWGLYSQANVRLAPDDTVITPDTIDREFGDPTSGEIYWDHLRDVIHDHLFADKSTKARAGHVVGMIRRFVADVEEGDVIIGTFPPADDAADDAGKRLIPGRVTGPARYDTSPVLSGAAENFLRFYRPIKWATFQDDYLSIPQERAPPGFGPTRWTFAEVGTPTPMVELVRFAEWMGDALDETDTSTDGADERAGTRITVSQDALQDVRETPEEGSGEELSIESGEDLQAFIDSLTE
jgi:hypothetical protein